MTDTSSHLLSVWAFDKQGHKVHPYRGKSGAKKGLYSVNFTNDTKKFQGMNEDELLQAIKQGRFRERGTIRMCRASLTSGSNAFAPAMYEGKQVKGF